MRELIADLFISLDGFAAGADEGPFFGYDAPELSAWVRAAGWRVVVETACEQRGRLYSTWVLEVAER